MSALTNDDLLSDGVTIKQNSGVRSKPWKRRDMEASQALSLAEFKASIKGRAFREFSLPSNSGKTIQAIGHKKLYTESQGISSLEQ